MEKLLLWKVLGDGHLTLGNIDNAIESYKEALVLSDDFNDFGKVVNDILGKINNNLGLAMKSKNFLEAAIMCFSKSLVAQLLSRDASLDTARTINNLASCHFDLHQYGHALNLFQRSLTIYSGLSLEDNFSQEIGKVHNNMGLCLMEQGDNKKAIESFQKYQKMLDISKDQKGLARVLNNIANCFSRLGNVPKALKFYQKAYEIQKDHCGEAAANEDLAMYLHNIGNCFLRRRSSLEALEHFQSALAMRKQVHGDRHASVANTLYSLGLVYKDLGKRRQSAANLEESLQLMKNAPNGQDLTGKIEQAINKRRFSIF